MDIQSLIFGAIAVVTALSFHELAHGWVAYKLGDNTAKNQGRLSLNPMKHLDPIGALMLIFVGFGWAKPVQVNPLAFRGNRKRGMIMVAAAGPISNLILAYASALVMKFLTLGIVPFNQTFFSFFNYFLLINIMLAVFNMIPLPPLDGWRVVGGVVPPKYYFKMQSVSQYSLLIILALSFTGILSAIISPITTVIAQLFYIMSGLA